jgi:hypothetical protein
VSTFNIKIEHKPTLGSEQTISKYAMKIALEALPVTWKKIKLDDKYFYAPSWQGCIKIIEYIQPKVPKYLTDKFDCDNFADWYKVHVADEFHINVFARIDGYADMGRGKGLEPHCWTLFTEGQYFYQLEPQNGVVMNIDDPLYQPDEITMG